MINELPSLFEVVTGAAKKQVKDKSSVSNHSSNKSKSNSKVVKENLRDLCTIYSFPVTDIYVDIDAFNVDVIKFGKCV